MTSEQLVACTFTLPVRQGDPDRNLRAVIHYSSPPSQAAFDGPLSASDIRGYKEDWLYIPKAGDPPVAWSLHDCDYEAIEKALLLADQGHPIYAARDDDGIFLAVEVGS